MSKQIYFLVSLLIIALASVYAQDVFADNYSLTMTTGGPQTIDVVLGNNGKGVSINEDQITVSTTCRYGYNLSIGASVNDNNLYLSGDSSHNSSGKFLSPADGLTVLNNATNIWGYYFNRSVTPTTASVFSPVPTSSSPKANIVTELASPSATDISDSFSIYYGATITETIDPGTYKMIEDSNHNDGAVVYYLTMAENCMPYTIVFNPTSTSTGSSLNGTGTMTPQEAYKDTPISLSTMSYTPPTNYEFKEWNTAQDGTGTSYNDEDSVTNLTTPGNSITLYAIWWQPPKTIANTEYLQDIDSCPSTLPTGQAYTVKDSRDGSEYSVAKLADGNCWMLDNLMLDPTDSSVAANIDATNTNADDESLDCLLGRTTGCTSPHTTAAVAVGSASPNNAHIIKSYKDTTTVHYGVNNGKTGIYYDSCTASAGTYCFGYGGEVDVPDTLYDYGGDICPAGWHIPTGSSSSGEFKSLYSAYSNSVGNISSPFALVLSGIYNTDYQNPPQNRGDIMYLWTSTYGGFGKVYYAGIGSRLSVTNSESNLDISMPVRCMFGSGR
ncbi:InlB B-repeat-containing protein [Candidatus Saccharibacteria bacterium]|nr:InlB B-repeat-containing protein [Candidatus Saccharibacteria bacterium]